MRTPPRASTLFDPGPATAGLTDRQKTVLDAIGRDGITAHEAGLAAGANPAWARTNGLEILRALKARGLVVERRNPPRYELAHKPSEPLGELPAGY
jgi:hypothetical protein